MKKSFLGKITFLLACVFTILFVLVKFYTVWMVGARFGGWNNWNNIMDVSPSIGVISENFVVPVICCIVCFIYLFEIGRNKIISRLVFVITAIALLVEMLFYILSHMNSYYHKIPILPLLLRIGFSLAFIVLSFGCANQLLRKTLYAVLGFSFVGTAIYWAMYYKQTITGIMQSLEILQGAELVYTYSAYFILPPLGLVVCGLVLCYALFPEKYLKSPNQIES